MEHFKVVFKKWPRAVIAPEEPSCCPITAEGEDIEYRSSIVFTVGEQSNSRCTTDTSHIHRLFVNN